MEHIPESSKAEENSNQPESNETKPSYLAFLRAIGGLHLVIGVISTLAFAVIILANMNRASYEDANNGWIIALALSLEGFIIYGLLYAIADIAENMIDIGSYVRDLSKRK